MKSFLRPWIASVFLLALAPVSEAAAQAPQPLYAVCGAVPPELRALKAVLGVDPAHGWVRTQIKGQEYWRGHFHGKDVIFFRTGTSIVNASYQLQLALDHFPITAVLFAGIAGGTDPSLGVGDVVIPDTWSYHDESAYLNKDEHGAYVKPAFFGDPKLANFGMIFPIPVDVQTEGHEDRMTGLPADPALLAAAKAALPYLPPLQKAGHPVHVTVGGTGVSGSVFLDNAEYRAWVYSVWKARCADMESAALAHVAYVNHTPLLVIRSLSDLAGGQHGANPVSKNELSVADIAAQVLGAILGRL